MNIPGTPSSFDGARIFCAPGRVNLIGDHTDYNNGFVMPAAIQFAARAAVTPERQKRIKVHSVQFNETKEWDLDEKLPEPRHHWSDYVRGVAVILQREGYELRGAKMVVDSSVPIGAGLSSSAALEVATGYALLANSGIVLAPTQVALLCQRAENQFVGARSGIMDQFISCHGKKGHVILLDCRSLENTFLSVPAHVRMVVSNTMVKHELASGEYNTRRAECERAVAFLKKCLPAIESLRDVTASGLDSCKGELDPRLYRRCRHVIGENLRVQRAKGALLEHNLRRLGELMYESHISLRDDYQVSCAELDTMVEVASAVPGNYGSRMMGGGFGGSTISLVEEDQVDEFMRVVAARYLRKTGISCVNYVCLAADGAHEEAPL